MEKFKEKKFWQKWNLTSTEYQLICQALNREPNELELGIFSVLWSEHCSYKNSRSLLKKLPTEASWVVQGPGENAGIIDIGEEELVVMKIESHNHPSAVEPFQGAATGVGGILRDIFTMGARPIALLDSLRFGNFQENLTQYLYSGVVGGISFYGNCIGVPTVAGETVFSDSYQGNILVNVMAVGLVKKGEIVRAVAKGVGNSVILIGAKTGRDGIGGAAFASVQLSEQSDEDRPAVQIGDPFTGKLLLEACLELAQFEEVVGLQDCGAAGLASSLSEMAARGESGIEVEISRVPQREMGMSPFEIILSESQERMVVVVEKGKEDRVLNTLKRWDLDSAIIGKVTEEQSFTIKDQGRQVASIPLPSLVGGAPIIKREAKRPEWIEKANHLDLKEIEEFDDYNQILLNLLASPNLSSKEEIYQQYDYLVQTNTLIPPGDDAAILRIKGSKKALALTTEGNGRYCFLDPRQGARIVVAEAARNLSCKGAIPKAVTDCLNFGAPENRASYWQLEQAIEGLSEACRFFETPVISGNVSLYNEKEGKSIDPTPIVGMVGVVGDYRQVCTLAFKKENDLIFILGESEEELGGSEYLEVVHKLKCGVPPVLDFEKEKKIQNFCRVMIEGGFLASAHDCSLGGLALTLAESCLANGLGAEVELKSDLRSDCFLFGETQSRIVVSISPTHYEKFREAALGEGILFQYIGIVKGNRLKINQWVNLAVSQLEKAWRRTGDGRLCEN
ncbi:MAG: phosphoribosylformylglycinamidine synthase subunit PurL [Atribacterota bacterium]|nr:phosphoribosylformylglycinamidine synthase subunit PurL [Atribacterota bacterium]